MNINLSVRAGNQFHQLYFALIKHRQEMLEHAIKQLCPYDDCLAQFATHMHDVAEIDELLTDMVTSLNYAISDAEEFKAPAGAVDKWSALVSEVKDNFSQTSQPASPMQKGGRTGE